jgi:hypothetical protein
MAGRDRITLGLGLIVAVLAMAAREYVWLQIPLAAFAVFLIVWGREGKRTEAFVSRLPGGSYALKTLEQLDLVLSPRDREYEQHRKNIIIGYDDDQRKALRELWRTRNTSHNPHLDRFVKDGWIEYPKDGPGWIKPELMAVVGRTLDERGV